MEQNDFRLPNGLTAKEDLERIDNLLNEVKDFLMLRGEAIPLDEWLTTKRYCERFNIPNTETVTNWIRRGIIPAENVKEVEELNGLKLIKAIPYKE
jgi:hypothetical protein